MGSTPTASRRLDTLGARLGFVLVAFVVVATVVVGGVEYARGRRAAVRSVTAELSARDNLVVDRLARGLEQRRRLVAEWPELGAAQDLAVDDVDKRLASALVRLAESFGEGEVAVGISPENVVLAASAMDWIGLTAADRAWATAPAPDSGATLRLTRDPTLGRVVAVMAPVRSRADGSRLGRIVLLSRWDSLLREAAGEHMGALTVVDDRSPAPAGELRSPPRAVALGDDTIRLALSAPLSEALRPLEAARRQLALLALVVLLVTVPSALLITRSNTAALRRLTESAREMEAGTGEAGGFEAPEGAPREVRVLAGALEKMVDRLEAARVELAHQESLAAMGTMAAVLAHEIRTPLSVLRGSADMLRKRVDDERGEELVSFLEEEIKRLERLVSDLLVFARPRPPEMGPVDLAAVAERAARAMGGRADTEGTALRTALEPARVRGDEEQLYQVALNLLSNALDAAEGGAVEVRTGDRDGAVLEVSDDGPGIDESLIDAVWTPFVTSRRGGTGLGLPLVRRIARAHGGDASIESTPGSGTRVWIALPHGEGEDA